MLTNRLLFVFQIRCVLHIFTISYRFYCNDTSDFSSFWLRHSRELYFFSMIYYPFLLDAGDSNTLTCRRMFFSRCACFVYEGCRFLPKVSSVIMWSIWDLHFNGVRHVVLSCQILSCDVLDLGIGLIILVYVYLVMQASGSQETTVMAFDFIPFVFLSGGLLGNAWVLNFLKLYKNIVLHELANKVNLF